MKISPLQIYDRRERAIVASADLVLAGAARLLHPLRRRRKPAAPRRILLLRLERIGDFLMAIPAVADVRALAPDAEIDLVVGSWNAELARSLSAVTRVETMDAGWMVRGGSGEGHARMLRRALAWRKRRYDLALNFEPDVRSNALLAVSGAAWTAGYRSAGGGPLLDEALEYNPRAHTSDNAQRLVKTAFGKSAVASADGGAPLLSIPNEHDRTAAALLGEARAPVVGIHVSGGRLVKQWDPDRFAAVAKGLISTHGATIVLTGTPGDRALIDQVKAALPASSVIDISEVASLLTVAAVLRRCHVMVTGDTGPMHLAYAVRTPIVAVFGPSDPRRYAPRGALDRVVRIDLPCAPCNRIRLPPARCAGHIPDCLRLVPESLVLSEVLDLLDTVDRTVRIPVA
ncbi:MAG TPA: glycosyltransferase family 9 protein [Vicinamibacterales bacterium]|nr:glycosyltransferase family 9 protein [Vicinamibacterales bacterium]